MLPEEMDAMGDGMTAGHRAARAAIKARRPDLPVGLSIAVMDDVVVGDDPSVRDRKRAEVYERWLELAREDDFVGVQNYERIPYDGSGAVPPARGRRPSTRWVPRSSRGSLGGAVRYAHAVDRVPVLVTEHGMAYRRRHASGGFIEPSLSGLLDAIEDGVPVLGYCHWTLLDNFEWIFGYDFHYGLHAVDRETFARTPKPSAGVYASYVKAQTL